MGVQRILQGGPEDAPWGSRGYSMGGHRILHGGSIGVQGIFHGGPPGDPETSPETSPALTLPMRLCDFCP